MVAALWIVARGGSADGTDVLQPADVKGATDSPVQEYLRFADTPRADQDRRSQEDLAYIVEGLRKLAGALGTLGVGEPDLQVDLRVAAEHLLLNPAAATNTPVVREALLSAAAALESEQLIGEANLKAVAGAISLDRPVLEQTAAVRTFFLESARAIRGLSDTRRWI
jgi:hypothetical protein